MEALRYPYLAGRSSMAFTAWAGSDCRPCYEHSIMHSETWANGSVSSLFRRPCVFQLGRREGRSGPVVQVRLGPSSPSGQAA